MEKRRYPKILFIIGLIANILFHYFWLFIPSIIFLIIGIFNRPFTYFGLALFGLDLLLSFVEQCKIRRTFLSANDHPDFQAFQQAVTSEGDWLKNVQDLLNSRIQSNDTKSEDEHESESDDPDKTS